MLRSSVICAALLFAAACYWGPSLKTFEPAYGPDGIGAQLQLRDTTIAGELLEVQDTAFIVLSDSRTVVLVPIAAIRSGTFDQRGVLLARGAASRRALAELRNLSRFPSGMSPEIRARLLAAYGQTVIQVAR